uniref:Putative upstream activation factor subunit spp27-like n=1 Tax=Davidia involucrata TaxID=16924 RepID=A0A5B6YUU8_DAVIN
MSSSSRVFHGCRALLAAAKAGTPKSSAAKTTAKSKTRSSSSPPPPPKQPRQLARSTGILKPVPVSPALRNFLGAPESSRTNAVKKVWEYIKAHELQNPANRKEIYCDDMLKTIFEGKEKVGFLEIGRLLSAHFVKTD